MDDRINELCARMMKAGDYVSGIVLMRQYADDVAKLDEPFPAWVGYYYGVMGFTPENVFGATTDEVLDKLEAQVVILEKLELKRG